MTDVPTFSFVVRAAANVMATMGSSDGPLIRSVNHSESKRRRSNSSTTWASEAWSFRSLPAPRAIPMRIFMSAEGSRRRGVTVRG